MTKHSSRDHRGRFTGSGAPIDGDPRAYEHVVSPSADPLGEHDKPARTVYADAHDFSRGPVTRRITPRHAVMINGETGERVATEVDHELRGLDTLHGGELRAQAHLQAAGDDAFAANLMSRPTYDINRRGHRLMGAAEDAGSSVTHHAWPGEVGKPMQASGV